jgi:hypothetical protein
MCIIIFVGLETFTANKLCKIIFDLLLVFLHAMQSLTTCCCKVHMTTGHLNETF